MLATALNIVDNFGTAIRFLGGRGSCRALESLVRPEPYPVARNIFDKTFTNECIAWEGEAPTEPLLHWFGKSLTLPVIFRSDVCAKLFRVILASYQR